MPRRNPSRVGLSYFDANSNRLISEGPDVLDIKEQINSRWPDVIEVWFDTVEEQWVIIEKCKDGVDRHVMSTKRLDQRVIDHLQKIDQAAHPQGDLNHTLEVQDAQAEKEKDHALSEAVGDGIERLMHALNKDGVMNTPKVFVSKAIR